MWNGSFFISFPSLFFALPLLPSSPLFPPSFSVSSSSFFISLFATRTQNLDSSAVPAFTRFMTMFICHYLSWEIRPAFVSFSRFSLTSPMARERHSEDDHFWNDEGNFLGGGEERRPSMGHGARLFTLMSQCFISPPISQFQRLCLRVAPCLCGRVGGF